MTPMSAPPLLVDQHVRARNLARARRLGPEDFLQRIALCDVQDRLQEVNKSFTAITIVTDFPEIWGPAFPDARCVAPDDRLSLNQSDLIIHAMALHWANDPVGQLVQCRKALIPDGLFLAVFPGGQTLYELRTALAEAEIAVTGGLSPRVLPMGELRALGALLGRAGFALPVADVLEQRVSYRNICHLTADLRAMGEGNAMTARGGPMPRAVLTRAESLYRTHFSDQNDPDRINATFDLVFLTGWAPAPNQPKPIRRGSAQISLEDALQKMRQE